MGSADDFGIRRVLPRHLHRLQDRAGWSQAGCPVGWFLEAQVCKDVAGGPFRA